MKNLCGYIKLIFVVLLLIILMFFFVMKYLKNKKIEKELIFLDKKWLYSDFSVINSGKAVLYRSNNFIKKKKIIAINAGHGTVGGEDKKTCCHPDKSPKVTGGSTAVNSIKATAISKGTTFLDGTSEAEVNLLVAQILKDKLLNYGYDVLMLRDDGDVQLDNIADIHLSIHFDDSANDKGAFYISVPDDESYLNMYPVSQYYKKHNNLGESLIKGLKKVGIKINDNVSLPLDLMQTSYSIIPSVDIELGDKKSKIDDFYLEKYALGLFEGIKRYFK